MTHLYKFCKLDFIFKSSWSNREDGFFYYDGSRLQACILDLRWEYTNRSKINYVLKDHHINLIITPFSKTKKGRV